MVIGFLAFEFTYAYAGFKTPLPVNTTVFDYPIFPLKSGPVIRADLHVGHLTLLHHILRIDTSVVRFSGGKPVDVSADINKTISLQRDGSVVRRFDEYVPNSTFAFSSDDLVSSEMNVLVIPVMGFDSMYLNLTIATDLHPCKAIRFKYSFADPRFDRFQQIVRLILSGCALYAFIRFVFFLKTGVYSHFQYISVVLGIGAIFATNPLSALCPGKLTNFLSPLFLALFLSVFRFFVIHFCDSIMSQQRRSRVVLFYLPMIIIYGVIEACANYSHCSIDSLLIHSSPADKGLSEKLLEICHIIYAIVIVVALVLAVRKAGAQLFRVAAFGIFAFATVVSTIITEVLIKRFETAKVSIFSILLYHSSHVLAAIVYLFLQHSVALEYENMDENSGVDRDRTLAVDFAED
jgi:hypothetical protein